MNPAEYRVMLAMKRDSIAKWKKQADWAQAEADACREKQVRAELELSQMMEKRYLQNVDN
jgi:hypothetical protein